MGARLLNFSLDSNFGQVCPFTAVHRQQEKLCVWTYQLWLLLQLTPKDVSDHEGRDRATVDCQRKKKYVPSSSKKVQLKMEFILNFVSSLSLANKYLASLHTSGGWEVAAGGS